MKLTGVGVGVAATVYLYRINRAKSELVEIEKRKARHEENTAFLAEIRNVEAVCKHCADDRGYCLIPEDLRPETCPKRKSKR